MNNPLRLVDDVVKAWWDEEIYEMLRDSPYRSFVNRENKEVELLDAKDVLNCRLRVWENEALPIEHFFDFDLAFENSLVEVYKEDDLYEDLAYKEPIWTAVQSLEKTQKNTGWLKITCDLSFFGRASIKVPNTSGEEDFESKFDDLCQDIASSLTLIDKPLAEYTDFPIKKIWNRIKVDGVSLLNWLNAV